VHKLSRYKCKVCGYIYYEEAGEPRRDTPPETKFNDLPGNWSCPKCGAKVNRFQAIK